MVNDLHLIRSMCSASGNASHVVTAWTNRLVVCVEGWQGDFFVFDHDGEESTAPVCFESGERGGESSFCCAVARGAL